MSAPPTRPEPPIDSADRATRAGSRLAQAEALLAPYAARASRARGRAQPETEHGYRSAFQRDRDRIVHSAAFRRLEHKTQVFVNTYGDHYRTRLTHTLEAAQIARTLARALGLNEDLTEAIALAHDLGHAPFGHAGGEALAEVMKDHGGFEHNRQSLRVVDVLERRYARFAGLNLSYEVRESIVKHGIDPSTETPDEAARSVPELARFAATEAPLLEAQLVDHCDSIAYDAHDLDDGLRAGLIQLNEVRELAIWRRAAERAREKHGADLGGAGPANAGSGAPYLGGPDLERHAVIRRIIDIMATGVVTTTELRIEARGIDSIAAVRAQSGFVVGLPEDLATERKELQRFLFERLYRHHVVMRIWRVAKDWLSRLFTAYVSEPLLLPPRWRTWCEEAGVERAVCDYLAGMTDRFAAKEVRRLFAPFDDRV